MSPPFMASLNASPIFHKNSSNDGSSLMGRTEVTERIQDWKTYKRIENKTSNLKSENHTHKDAQSLFM